VLLICDWRELFGRGEKFLNQISGLDGMRTCPCSKIYLVSDSVYRLGLRLVIIYSPSKTSATAGSHTWAGGVMHSSDAVSKQNNPSP
jgi:hypothetical protein